VRGDDTGSSPVTDLPDFPVSPAKRASLIERMLKLGVEESDLEESFTKSAGPGGQNVNKVETCVILRHVPTGTMVRYQVSRSQAFNRFMARRLLIEELEAQKLGAESSRQRAIWKIRKQKARRSRRAKEKILRDKHIQSAKKIQRRKPGRVYGEPE
jgi:protein subunit release factor B